MHKIKKYIFFNIHKILEISVEKYADGKVHTITIVNRKSFWVRMHDVQEGLCLI